MRNISPSKTKEELKRCEEVAKCIIEGLNGKPFNWGGSEGSANRCTSAKMGARLVTRTMLKKLGYRLKRGAKPVGSCYYGSPINRTADLFVLQCQAVKEE